MKKSTGYLKYTAVLALATVLVALMVWITGMCRSSTANYRQSANIYLSRAVETELNMRRSSGKVSHKNWFEAYDKGDTSTYVTKSIELEDTIIHLRFKKDDPIALNKMRQYILQFIYPVNVAQMDSIFKKYMADNSLPVKASYVEYLDLKKNMIISSNAPEDRRSGYFASNIDTLDILKTIGVRAYMRTPLLVIMRPVITELIIAVALILFVMGCIIKMIVDIRRLHIEGFRLLRFVSLKAEHALVEAAGQVGHSAGILHDKGLEEESGELEKTKEGILISTGYFERLRSILNNEEGKIKFNKTVFCIKTLLDELQEQYEKLVYKDVTIDIAADYGVMIHTDRYYLKRIFEEILDNSVKYSSNIVLVKIIVSSQKQKTVIVVCDAGGGISSSDMENMYIINHNLARYFKEEIKRETKRGLGISFVVSFVRALGGEVKITSDDGMTGVRIVLSSSKDDLQKIASHHTADTDPLHLKTINFTEHISTC